MEQQILQKIREGYDFRTMTYIRQGLQNFASNWFQYMVIAIAGGTISALAQRIPGLGILSGFIVAPLITASMLIVSEKVYRNENTTFKDFLESTKHLGGLIIATILQGLVLVGFMFLLMMVLMFPFIAIIKDYDISANFMESGVVYPIAGFSMLLMLLIFAVYTCYYFTFNYVIFGNIDGSKAMTFSRKVVMKQYGKIFLYILIISTLLFSYTAVVFVYSGQIEIFKTLIGAMINKDLEAINALKDQSNWVRDVISAACLSFFSPIAHCINQAAFRDIHQLDNIEEVDNTIEHFIES
jgi:hypothetical protein